MMLLFVCPALIATGRSETSKLRVSPTKILQFISPSEVFGVAVDGGSLAESSGLLSRINTDAIRAARFGNASYRLRTELAGQVWHWTSHGKWSDQEHRQGYWVGDASQDDNHELTFGYRLPRRGNSRDEADDDGFSRIDDGNKATFWKSNPYLDPALEGTGVEQQWVIFDLGRMRHFNAVQIQWAEPYAAQFVVQRWVGEDQYNGEWRDITSSLSGHAGFQPLRFGAVDARFVRILLIKSSHMAVGRDPRDAMGYGIDEVRIGLQSLNRFHDYLIHAASGLKQTPITVSSTDPWHREADRDADAVQPSPIALHARGLVTGSFTIPLGLLTDIPENAIAELNYFHRRGLPIQAVELGEEPEGQLAPPRMVAALYSRLASRIAREHPETPIGGPSLIDPAADTTLDDQDASWTRAFVAELRQSHQDRSMSFLSTELYPVDNVCRPEAALLAKVSKAAGRLVRRFHQDQVGDIPIVITEYGLSPYSGKALQRFVSAVADADILATSLTRGVRRMYLYGTSPTSAVPGNRGCAGSGNLTLWNSDALGRILSPSIRMRVFEALRDHWSKPDDIKEQLLQVTGAPAGIDSFALRRGDASMSILIINRSSRGVRVELNLRSLSMNSLISFRSPGIEKRQAPVPRNLVVPPLSITIIETNPPS